ncbi:MAG: DMT family transporter [Nostoc sp. EkiNYC01]|nr:multidrug efflux SMR transporter [Nostoc sp. EkiNYC01]
MSNWIYLLVAIVLEILATSCMKLSEGFSKVLPSILMFVLYGICFTIMTFVLTKIELGVVYAIWSGLGTAVISAIGIFWLNESASLVKIGAILLIIIGVAILKLNPESSILDEKKLFQAQVTGMTIPETTQAVKIEEALSPAENTVLLMPQMLTNYPKLEQPSKTRSEQLENQT